MNKHVLAIVAATAVGVVSVTSGSPVAVAGTGSSPGTHAWGTAEEVPGTAAFNQGGYAYLA